jgi:ketosteroid isomerase-like protein
MLNPDVPIEELTDAYRNWRETRGGNLDQVLALFDDQIEMHSVLEPDVSHELARVQRSREDAKNYFRELLDNWEMIDFPQEKIVADGDTVVWIGRCHWRNKHDGKELIRRRSTSGPSATARRSASSKCSTASDLRARPV